MIIEETVMTEELARELCKWKYDCKSIPVMSWSEIETCIPELTMEKSRKKEFVAFCDSGNSVFLGWCRGRFFTVRGMEVIYLGYAVNPDFQGRGIGKKILQDSCGIFTKRYGEYPFMVDIGEDNSRLLRLVKSLGFKYLYSLNSEDCGNIIKCKRFLLKGN